MSLRVVLLTNFLPPYRLPFLAALEQRTGELVVLVSSDMERNRDWPVDHGSLTVHRQRTLSLRERRKDRRGFSERREIHIPVDTLRRLEQLRPDVIVSVELGVRTGLAARYAARTGTPLACWVTMSSETEANLGRVRKAYRRRLARRIRHWFVNGASGAEEVRSYGAPPESITVVSNATVPEAGTHKRVPSNGPLRLLYVGQLIERKWIVQFCEQLNAWATARELADRVQLTIVGSGPLAGRIADLIRRSEVRIDVRGSIGYPEILSEYSQHDVLAIPSLVDAWAIVVNEAMAAGLIVLGSVHCEAVREMVEDGVTGIVFDPAEGGGGAFDRLWGLAPEVRDVMGQAAIVRAAEFAVEPMADRAATTLRRIAGRSAEGGSRSH